MCPFFTLCNVTRSVCYGTVVGLQETTNNLNIEAHSRRVSGCVIAQADVTSADIRHKTRSTGKLKAASDFQTLQISSSRLEITDILGTFPLRCPHLRIYSAPPDIMAPNSKFNTLLSSVLLQLCLATLGLAAPVVVQSPKNSWQYGTGGGLLGLVILILDIIVFGKWPLSRPDHPRNAC